MLTHPHQTVSRSAFTLTELLIVVTIIAMLAAIAVPNLLDAQTRAKVSRSRADLRAVATALETYRADHSRYPLVGSLTMPGPWDMSVPYLKRLVPLTTPIAYMTTIPRDAFASHASATIRGAQYCYAPGNLYHGGAAIYSGAQYRNTIYSVSGRGPDTHIGAGDYCLAHPTAWQTGLGVRGAYDPTNGTVSEGDIVQLSCARL